LSYLANRQTDKQTLAKNITSLAEVITDCSRLVLVVAAAYFLWWNRSATLVHWE